jgi:molecular chaperone GrpE
MSDRTNGAPKGSHKDKHGGQPRTRAEERIAALDASTAGVATEVEQLKEQLAQAQQEAAENLASWQRAAADFANYRRRTDQQRLEDLGLANESLIHKVVALADDFDLAVDHVPADQRSSAWVEGIVAIDRKLRTLLESEGVTAIEAEGKPFDPREHEAVSHEETTEVPDGTVLRELQRGYYLRDRVLRPALVAVANNTSTSQSATNQPPSGAHESGE